MSTGIRPSSTAEVARTRAEACFNVRVQAEIEARVASGVGSERPNCALTELTSPSARHNCLWWR